MRKSLKDAVEQKAIKLLEEHKLRRTKNRLEVLKALIGQNKPLAHSDIMSRLKGKRFDRVSVYRCLQRFVEKGIVHKAYISDRNDMFEIADRCGEDYCHPHFSCRVCKETICMNDICVPVIRNLGKGFIPSRQKIFIEGTCPKCSDR